MGRQHLYAAHKIDIPPLPFCLAKHLMQPLRRDLQPPSHSPAPPLSREAALPYRPPPKISYDSSGHGKFRHFRAFEKEVKEDEDKGEVADGEDEEAEKAAFFVRRCEEGAEGDDGEEAGAPKDPGGERDGDYLWCGMCVSAAGVLCGIETWQGADHGSQTGYSQLPDVVG